ncbi:MAG TPA: dienelactone hydrolase family protein [Vicinamibacterales bacterium]|nr:dienelactone hydrolase family protein [Vicinamibacterales bacterium]
MHEGFDPHATQPVRRAGIAIPDARLVAVLLHGRGASAENILALSAELPVSDVAYLAPQAAGGTWYPYSFLAPLEQNEPWLGSALRMLSRLVDELQRQGVTRERIALGGFSQGACLALEFAARSAGRYAAVFALSGGLIGPPGTPRDYEGSFDGTPVFIGSSDIDPHVPLERVHESTAVFTRMGARVDERIYPGMPHTVNRDELEAVAALLSGQPGT